MKTIEELANLGAAAALAPRPTEYNISVSTESAFWHKDQPAREAFARAVRDEVLREQFLDEQKPTINQPAADVPTWRPIAELPDDEREYVYWDGEMSWHGNPQEKVDATHFIAHPPKPDPFEAWWATQNFGAFGSYKAECREAWNAAREAKP